MPVVCSRCFRCDCLDCGQVECGCENSSCVRSPDHASECEGLAVVVEINGNPFCSACAESIRDNEGELLKAERLLADANEPPPRLTQPASHADVTLDQIEECLERSGYLLESRVARALDARSFFVDPNQVIRDPITGKSREIDLVAERWVYDPEHRHAFVRTYFVGEVINNRFPFVLLTERPNSPTPDFETDYLKFIRTPSSRPFDLDVWRERGFDDRNLFSQYCVLTEKKSGGRHDAKELLASHSDDAHSSLQKLTYYIEGEMQRWTAEDFQEDNIWRLFFWHPLLILGGQLITARGSPSGSVKLQAVESAFLEFNWHAGEARRTTAVEVITADALVPRLERIVEADLRLETQLHDLRTRSPKK